MRRLQPLPRTEVLCRALLTLSFASAPAFAAPEVQWVGRIEENLRDCLTEFAALAREAVEKRKPGRVARVAVGYPDVWEDLLKKAGSEPKHSAVSQKWLNKLAEAEELPPEMGDVAEVYRRLVGSDDLAVCVAPHICADGQPFGKPPAWMRTTTPGHLEFHGDGIDDDSIRTLSPAEIVRHEKILRENGPRYLVVMEGLLPEMSNGSGNQALIHISNFVHELKHISDLGLLERWAEKNAQAIKAGKSPDRLFEKYGKITDDGKPSLDGRFVILFTESRAWAAGTRAVNYYMPQISWESLKEGNQALALDTTTKAGPGVVAVARAENVNSTNFFQMGTDWGAEMDKFIRENPL